MSKKDFRNYFNKKRPIGAFVILIISLLLFASGAGSTFIEIIAFAILLIGVFKVYHYLSHQEEAIDKYCEKMAEEYYYEKRSMVNSYKVAIEEEMHCYGYLFENMFSARMSRVGKNGVVRSSILEIACVFFSKDTLYCYNKRLSLITDEKFENQKEFCISDIQVVSMEVINQNVYVVIIIPGSEKIYLKCNDKNLAVGLCDRIKQKL